MHSTSLPLSPAARAASSEQPKWIAVVGDVLVPMPRRHVVARLVKAQAGMSTATVLIRDHNSPNDVILADDVLLDLAEGNVFYGASDCQVADRPACAEPAKLAFVVNDRWEIVTRPNQTASTLRDLFGLTPDVELIRDYESPHDVLLADTDQANFSDGPVFLTQKRKVIEIFVNTKPVKMPRGSTSGLEIKQAAVDQGVSICMDCVLYRVKPDGGHSPAIRDHERVHLECGYQFRCIAPDDNS